MNNFCHETATLIENFIKKSTISDLHFETYSEIAEKIYDNITSYEGIQTWNENKTDPLKSGYYLALIEIEDEPIDIPTIQLFDLEEGWKLLPGYELRAWTNLPLTANLETQEEDNNLFLQDTIHKFIDRFYLLSFKIIKLILQKKLLNKNFECQFDIDTHIFLSTFYFRDKNRKDLYKIQINFEETNMFLMLEYSEKLQSLYKILDTSDSLESIISSVKQLNG